MFNYKHLLHDLYIDDFKSKPPDCICASSPFIYNPTGHVITGDLTIINNTSLRDVFAQGLKYREPKSINWKHNFKILMDSVEDYARQWAKRDLDTLSECVKSGRSLIQIRIKKFSGSMSTRSTSIFKNTNVAKHLSLLHDNYVIVSTDKAPNNIVFALEFQPKMKNWIYHHSTGFLKYTSALSNSAILLGLPNAPRNLLPNY
jgi:hypothetical protein